MAGPGAPVNFAFSVTSPATIVVPVSGEMSWVTAIDAGGLVNDDLVGSETTVRRGDQIQATTHHPLIRNGTHGTTLRLRLRYPTSMSSTVTKPIIRVFGYDVAGYAAALRNADNELSVVLPFDPATDSIVAVGGTDFCVTTPDNTMHAWDCNGCLKFLIGIERKMGSVGSGALLEAMII